MLRNETDHPLAAMLEHVATGSAGVPMSFVVELVGAPAAPVRAGSAPKPAGKINRNGSGACESVIARRP